MIKKYNSEDTLPIGITKVTLAQTLFDPVRDNKELMIIPDAVHTDLYDGGNKDAIPFDKMTAFFNTYLK